MAIDINKVRARLAQLTTNNKKSDLLWKPPEGKSVIRILPYLPHQPDSPFIELLFHYGINKKTYLSPSTFGKPDPIVELAEKMRTSGDREDWKLGTKLLPKMRTHVPILVRGSDKEGVKYWGFGKQVYESILNIIADPDYGDITDLENGHDITVDFKPGQGNDFAETTILAKPKPTVATFDKDILEKIKKQIDILTLFPETSYEKLESELDLHLNPRSGEESDKDSDKDSEKPEEKPKSTPKSTDEVADEFDDLLNSN